MLNIVVFFKNILSTGESKFDNDNIYKKVKGNQKIVWKVTGCQGKALDGDNWWPLKRTPFSQIHLNSQNYKHVLRKDPITALLEDVIHSQSVNSEEQLSERTELD